MHAEGRAAPCLGVSGALGEQTRRCARSGGVGAGTDESAKCTRLADVARLSVAHAEVASLIVPIHEADLRRPIGRARSPLRAVGRPFKSRARE